MDYDCYNSKEGWVCTNKAEENSRFIKMIRVRPTKQESIDALLLALNKKD